MTLQPFPVTCPPLPAHRLRLVSCCRALARGRPDVAASRQLWGDLGALGPRQAGPGLLAWLVRHRAGLRQLVLDGHLSVSDLLSALEGAPLAGLGVCNSPALSGSADAALRPLAGFTQLQQLDLGHCRLRALPRPVSTLTQLRELSVAGNIILWQGGEEGFAPLQSLVLLSRLDLSSCRWAGRSGAAGCSPAEQRPAKCCN